uniref:Adenosine kinase n=1 Tax=Lactuca sativa TaxID=4236 RepID=A0A9R1V3Z5_LACSA|nr:hypothetical protein LSAT_V11C700360950 [Lactuca sativa]
MDLDTNPTDNDDVYQVHYYVDEGAPIGTCVVCVVGVEKAKYIYIAGFFLTVSPESIQLVVEHAAAANKVFTINPSTPFICEFSKDAQEKALPYVDYVFGNKTEARTFSKVHGWETDNVEEIAIG